MVSLHANSPCCWQLDKLHPSPAIPFCAHSHALPIALFLSFLGNKSPCSQPCNANNPVQPFSLMNLSSLNPQIPSLASTECFCVVSVTSQGWREKPTPLVSRVSCTTLRGSSVESHLNWLCRKCWSGVCCPPTGGLCQQNRTEQVVWLWWATKPNTGGQVILSLSTKQQH